MLSMVGMFHIFLFFVSVFVCVRERQTEFLFATEVRQWSCLSQTFRVTKREHLVGGWLTGRGNNSEIMARQGWEGRRRIPPLWVAVEKVCCMLSSYQPPPDLPTEWGGRGGWGRTREKWLGPHFITNHILCNIIYPRQKICPSRVDYRSADKNWKWQSLQKKKKSRVVFSLDVTLIVQLFYVCLKFISNCCSLLFPTPSPLPRPPPPLGIVDKLN